jgi:hypothetical protein
MGSMLKRMDMLFVMHFVFIAHIEHFVYKLIHNWGSKKRKKNSKTFVGLLFANNIYFKQT